jgi:hypothetical protein
MSEAGRKFQIAASLTLAGGFILSAIAQMKNSANAASTAAAEGQMPMRGISFDMSTRPGRVLPLPRAQLPTKMPASGVPGKPKLKQYDLTDIDDRVGLIGELIRKGSLHPELREKTIEILSLKCDMLGRADPNGSQWCVKEKDCLGEVKAIFDAIRNPSSKFAVRYTRDAMLADVFTAPERTLLKSHGGDCDDYVITIGSMLMAVGHSVRMRVVATRNERFEDSKAPWSHIYLLTPTTFDNPNAKWISVDASMNKPLGWEAPGAAEVAKTGKPAGIIARVRDYSIVKPNEAT